MEKCHKSILNEKRSGWFWIAHLYAGFRVDRVPEALDAIIIGSGVGGLTAAALLAKAGKRVLILEQHDQAGGCTHTFENKGFEFDVGKPTNLHVAEFMLQQRYLAKLTFQNKYIQRCFCYLQYNCVTWWLFYMPVK